MLPSTAETFVLVGGASGPTSCWSAVSKSWFAVDVSTATLADQALSIPQHTRLLCHRSPTQQWPVDKAADADLETIRLVSLADPVRARCGGQWHQTWCEAASSGVHDAACEVPAVAVVAGREYGLRGLPIL
jgi:hypothetical protein